MFFKLIVLKQNAAKVTSFHLGHIMNVNGILWGVFYISGPGSFKLLGHASYPIQQIFNVDCGGGESFIIVDKKAYLATRDKNKNITQIDRLKSVECQNVGNVCDEQTFAMCKYPEGVK